MSKMKAMVHTLNEVGDVEIVEKAGDNQYIAKFREGYFTAIFNYFTGLYYVDDVYGGVKYEK